MVKVAETDMLLVGCQCEVGVRIRSTPKVEAACLGRVLLNVVEAGSFVYECATILLPEEPK